MWDVKLFGSLGYTAEDSAFILTMWDVKHVTLEDFDDDYELLY